jgi:serologically defined colon cancer antigen 8
MSASQAELNWKFNACKKIAQLTKVVFRLHTESLDRKDFVAHVKKKCDQEIEAVVQRSSEATQEVQRDASEYRETLQQIVREEYQAKFENQSREYEVLKTRLNSETKQVVDRSMLQISALKKEIESLRSGTEKAKQMFEDAVRDLEKANQKVIDAVAQKHQRELERCIQAGNEKCNALVLQNASREDEIRKELQQEMIDLKRNATADSLTQSETLKRKVFELENKIKGMESAAKKMNYTINSLKVEVDRMSKENAALQEEADSKQEDMRRRRTSDLTELSERFE